MECNHSSVIINVHPYFNNRGTEIYLSNNYNNDDNSNSSKLQMGVVMVITCTIPLDDGS